jgi:hypothetical protein
MGCHTRYLVPIVRGKEEILALARQFFNQSAYTDDWRQMFQYAIDKELSEPCCNLAANMLHKDHGAYITHSENWILYGSVECRTYVEYNKLHGTNYIKYRNSLKDTYIEHYSDEPRVGGYPEDIVRNYDQMMSLISTGVSTENGVYQFNIPEERKEFIYNQIRVFFERHPDGIITFG